MPSTELGVEESAIVEWKMTTGGRANLAQLIDMLKDAGYSFDVISNYRGSRPNLRRLPPR